MTTLPLSFLDNATAQDVKALSPEQLQSLQARLHDELTLNKSRKRVLEDGLNLKYFEAAKIALRSTHRDTGLIRFKDGRHVIVTDIPKKVSWDQEKLIPIVEKLSSPAQLPGLSLTYSINENAYKTWPFQTQALFMPARTIKLGTPTFALIEETL